MQNSGYTALLHGYGKLLKCKTTVYVGN